MDNVNNETSESKPHAMEKVIAARRAAGECSPRAFAQVYLKSHFKCAPCSMHIEILDSLCEATKKRGVKLAIAAPRGHAKSTLVSLGHVLWSICYKREPFIVLCSNTASQANDLLSHVKKELEENPLLLEDFPEVCEQPGARRGPPVWRKDEIITRNGVRVAAFGAEKQIRGRRHRQDRPSLIILDDAESDTSSTSEVEREKRFTWLMGSVVPAGTAETNIIVVGTLLHYDTMLARLLDPKKCPGWVGKRYQAVIKWATRTDLWCQWEKIFIGDEAYEEVSGPKAAIDFYLANEKMMLEGAQVSWPERESYLQLMEQRLTMGRMAFDAEKQNDPLDPATCLFRDDIIKYWDNVYKTEDELLAFLGPNAQMYGAVDPSLGKAGKIGDFTVIITLVKDKRTGIKYVLDAFIEKLGPDQTIETIIAVHQRRRYRHFGVEVNQFQSFLGSELIKRSRQRGNQIPVVEIKTVNDKVGRIQSLEPHVRTGGILFSRKHRLLMEQLRQFPKAAHDDGPDALEMAFNLRLPPQSGITFIDWPNPWDDDLDKYDMKKQLKAFMRS